MKVYLRPIDARVMVPGYVAWRRGGVGCVVALALGFSVLAVAMMAGWHEGVTAWLLAATLNAFAWPWILPRRARR